MWGVVSLGACADHRVVCFLPGTMWGEKVVTASTSVNGQEFPICSVETGKKQIAYTFELSGTQIGKREQAEQMLQILQTAGDSGHIFCHSVLDREPQESGNTDLSAGT